MTVEKVTHRGIRWQRNDRGGIRWWNEGQEAWVRWHPGDDAPPRPAGWDRRAPHAPPPLTRPPWRSPYRVIPLVLVVIVLVLGLIQALRSNGSTTGGATETKQAEAFSGRCLPKASAKPDAGYLSTPVACSSPTAAGKVVAVVTWQAGPKACPAATTPAILTSGVSHPHFECIAKLG